MAHKIALVTDSTCDIPPAWREQYEIEVVPLTIIFGEKTFLDGVEMTAEQFYERLPKEKAHPTTSQPTPGAYLNAYRRAAERGAEEILLIAISAGFSGAIQSARQAASEFERPVHIFDSRSNSMGLGWQVIAAARARAAGGDLQAMLAAAEQARDHMVYYITLDTIDYLGRGGRIGDAARLLNSFLQIKPLILVKPNTGTVGVAMPARSRKGAVEGLIKEFRAHIDPARPLHLTVLHNNVPEEAQALAERMQRELNPVEIFVNIVSPILGVHTGPGALALCGYNE